jgi:hypothetical protein
MNLLSSTGSISARATQRSVTGGESMEEKRWSRVWEVRRMVDVISGWQLTSQLCYLREKEAYWPRSELICPEVKSSISLPSLS